MKRVFALIALSAVTVSVAVAFAQQQPTKQPTKQPAQQAPPQQAVEPALSAEDRARRAKVVAKVGEARITVGEVEDQINQQSPFLRARYRDPAKLREFAENMIRFELLARAAVRDGYADNDAVVRSVKQNAVQQLIRQEFDERITPESIPEADVREYYDGNEPEFQRPAMVRASHILVADRARAQELIQELSSADARAFRQAAREHSIDTETKLRGGDLRYFTEAGQAPNARDASVDPAIVQAAFRLRDVGHMVSEPIQVGDQFSIVKLTGKRPAEHRSFEDAEQGIRLRLWRQRRQDAIERFVTELRQRYGPEVHEDRMGPIRLETTAELPAGDPHGGSHGDPAGGAEGLDEPDPGE